jgi:hypothetical protein
MLSIQRNFFSPTEELTAERFSQLIVSDAVVNTIAELRQLKEQAATIEAAGAPEEQPKVRQLRKDADRLKRSLPKIIWQATFDETTSRKGYTARWRAQRAARLNGLFMLDIDHVDDPEKLWYDWINQDAAAQPFGGDAIGQFAHRHGIVLAHVTPSGHGLRLVAKADINCGNIADNQLRLANTLKVAPDESCKDASRLSFCPSFNDILYINHNELFTYNNEDYDEKYGAQYRQNSSQPTRRPAAGGVHGAALCHGVAAPAASHGDGVVLDGAAQDRLVEIVKQGYHGVPYKDIIAKWFELHNGGSAPAAGDRHRVLLRLAAHLRYICNNQPAMLAAAMREHPMVDAYAVEDPTDFAGITNSACEKQLWVALPRNFRTVLDALGVQLPEQANVAGAGAQAALDYEAYWHRLEPLLAESPVLREAVADLPEHHRLGGVLAAGAMLGTYLTRTWWEHFDGKFYRLSFLVYIIGAAASGKSFITLLDKLLLAPLQAADRLGREAERTYKEKEKKRKANEALPDRPHPVIRYCPSSTSNAILYRRLQDAIDNDVTDPDTGEPLHLHLITVESEIATALRAQVGSWAGKADLELKSFHNEVAGVDFANAESTNGPMQINWNEVMSGTTESMSRKIMPRNVLDGLVTRLVLFLMPDNDYAMLERRRALRNHERECLLRSVGYDLEKVTGELHVPRLVDFCYQYEEELTRRALVEQDRCLDYFRKRIPVIMIRYTLVRMVLRQLEAAKKGEDLVVDDSDLEFARLIGDWCLEAQVHLFGQMVLEALDAEQQTFKPRGISSEGMKKCEQLPKTISAKVLVENGICKDINTATSYLTRWLKGGLIKKTARGTYEKCENN